MPVLVCTLDKEVREENKSGGLEYYAHPGGVVVTEREELVEKLLGKKHWRVATPEEAAAILAPVAELPDDAIRVQPEEVAPTATPEVAGYGALGLAE